MPQNFNPIRYSIITEKNPREIVMLRGSGCKWRKCRFCDYHTDFSPDEKANYQINKKELQKVTGLYNRLEIINSGSFTDLNQNTLSLIKDICQQKKITQLHFECHWLHREAVAAFKADFQSHGIQVKIKIGVETFDHLYRESFLVKGMPNIKPDEIARYFDEVCLLFGLPGQTEESMKKDIETGLSLFERICINIMVENSCPVRPDPKVIQIFAEKLLPVYKENERVDILMENTEFGVGGEANV